MTVIGLLMLKSSSVCDGVALLLSAVPSRSRSAPRKRSEKPVLSDETGNPGGRRSLAFSKLNRGKLNPFRIPMEFFMRINTLSSRRLLVLMG